MTASSSQAVKVPNVASPSGSCSAVSRIPAIGNSAMIENTPRIT